MLLNIVLQQLLRKNDMRLIAIVLGEEVSKVRNSETMALLRLWI